MEEDIVEIYKKQRIATFGAFAWRMKVIEPYLKNEGYFAFVFLFFYFSIFLFYYFELQRV